MIDTNPATVRSAAGLIMDTRDLFGGRTIKKSNAK